MLKDNIFMYYFLKVKEQFISLHLIYIKHFMANNCLLNYWINEVHWGYNYLLVVILLLVISILLYRIRKLQKTIKKTNHSYRLSFDILDNLPASLLKLRLLTACYGEVFDEPLADEGRIIIASWDSASLTSDQQEAIKEFQNVVDNSYPWEYIDE